MKEGIEFANSRDLEFILEGIYEICKLEKEKPESKDYLVKQSLKAIRNKKIKVFRINDKPIAYIQFDFSRKSPYGLDYGPWKRTFCWIDWIYVKEQHRNKNIGRLLVDDIERMCKRMKIREIMLDVFEVNSNAINFYKKIGINHIIHIMHKRI